MASRLQARIDTLAGQLGRMVTLDDADWCLEAHSAALDEVDPVRLDAILHRRARPEVAAWAHELGLGRATEPVRTPANPALGAAARVVFPLRRAGRLLGYLTVVDREQTLSDAEQRATAAIADELAALWEDQDGRRADRSAREQELVSALVGDDPELRVQAAWALVAERFLVDDGPVTALVVLARGGADAGRETDRQRLAHAVAAARDQAPPRTTLGAVGDGSAIVLVTARGDAAPVALAGRVRAAGGGGDELAVGIGTVAGLAVARVSWRRASVAARVAARIGGDSGTTSWATLGAYRALASLVPAGGEPEPGSTIAELLDPRLLALAERDRTGTLLVTLEAYLDRAGDVQATARSLSLQRSGLYYRLERISELAGVDLHDGGERLSLHLSLKLARLAGHPLLAGATAHTTAQTPPSTLTAVPVT